MDSLVDSPGHALDPLYRALLLRAFRGSLHRLRGLRNLFSGWIEFGLPPGAETRVRIKQEEDAALLARLDWLGTMLSHGATRAQLTGGEAPAILLAAALGLHTPEEAGVRLPRIGEPEAALAAALWLQAKAPVAVLGHDLHLRWQGRSAIFELAAPRNVDLTAWQTELASWVAQQEESRLVLRPGALSDPVPEEERLQD